MLTQHSQRWRDGRTVFVTGAAFDPAAYSVATIPEADARAFVAANHYASSFPAARLSVGLLRSRPGRGAQLAGVAVFSVPMNQAVVPRYTAMPANAGAEFGRLVLLDDVPMPGESWFCSRAFKTLRERRPALEAVVSYADPGTRRDASGAIERRGHVGRVYASLSGAYHGRTAERPQWFAPGGRLISERALSKIRGRESGQDYAVAQLVACGAPPPAEGVNPAVWLDGLRRAGFLRRGMAPAKHVYSWGLTRRARRAARDVPRFAYPVVGDPTAQDVTALPLFA